jgi:hypothetical protein
VTDGKNFISRRGLPYARPGEMVTVSLKHNQFDAIQQAKELIISVSAR